MTVTWIDDGQPDVAVTTLQLGSSGIILGQTDAYGVIWDWDAPSPFGPKPAPREETSDRPGRDGQADATATYGARLREVKGVVRAPSHLALHRAQQRLEASIGVDAIPVTITEPGFQGFLMMRQSGELLWTEGGNPDSTGHPTAATFSFNLYAKDPRILSTTLRTFTLNYPTAGGGRSWPASWPGSWPASTVLSQVSLTNPGPVPAGLLLHFNGPVTTAGISVQTGSQFWALNLANPNGSPLLATGEILDVDTDRHTVKLQTTSDRPSFAYGDWPMLPPYSTSVVSLFGSAGAGAQLTGSYRAARR